MTDSITPAALDRLLGEGADVRVLDVRRKKDRVDVEYPIAGSQWRDPEQVEAWSRNLGNPGEVIVYCVHGHHVSQSTRDALRRQGIASRIVEGGIAAWCAYAESRESVAIDPPVHLPQNGGSGEGS